MRFPRIHLATSVTNRILDMADQEQIQASVTTEGPLVPDTSQQSLALDQAIQAPPQAVPAPVGSEDAAALEMQQGGSAADAIGSLAVIDTMGGAVI